MRFKEKKWNLQDVEIPALERDSEGKLKGGFSVVKTSSNDGDGWGVNLLCHCLCGKPDVDNPTPPPPPPTPPTDGNEPPTDASEGGFLGSSLIF